MNPIAMTLLLLVGWGIFAYSTRRRWRLMMVGAKDDRSDQIPERISRTIKYAIAQLRMRRYPLAGFAHMLIFAGFGVLLLRTLILWGRGFDNSFNFWLFGTDHWLGQVYSFLKDLFAVLVMLGTLVFVYFRVIKKLPRMTLSTEGLVILMIILVMMLADIFYDGASIVLQSRSTPQRQALAPITIVNPSPFVGQTITAYTEYGIVTQTVPGSETIDPDAYETKIVGYQVEEDSPLTRNAPPVVTPRTFSDEPDRREVITFEEVLDKQGRVVGRVPVSTYRDLTSKELESLQHVGLTFIIYEPAGSIAAQIVSGLPDGLLVIVQHLGFWTHSAMVLIFLNLLPYSKHFHVITGIPNVYTQSLHPPGRLPPITDIEGKLEREETLGIKRIDQFSWKSILDFYTCTECGRCSDYCPATMTGKKLSPKHFTLDLRNFLYQHEDALVASANATDQSETSRSPSGSGSDDSETGAQAIDQTETRPSGSERNSDSQEHQIDLVGGIIDPEVLWACTSCRACEQECPVFITYVDKIVDMRRYLVQERGEFPNELQSAFRGLESSGNPWSFPADDRPAWASDLDIKLLKDHPETPVLFWVGCMPAFDERAKKVTRATAKLMQQAGVDFAILGTEETCTGDPARRAGNEYLFQMFAKQNVETLNGYNAGKKKIITTCPHCFNTLLNEYGDFGGKFDVIHHTTFLAQLIKEGKLKPTKRIDKKIVYHDSCYLGRYNEVYDPPREVLNSIPGLTVLEPKETRDRGMCCGAGGAQMFKEEESGDERISERRAQQLLDTNPDAVSSACPFCMRMLTDGLASKNHEEVESLDIAELLLESVMES